jgi:outer membrane protein TolC
MAARLGFPAILVALMGLMSGAAAGQSLPAASQGARPIASVAMGDPHELTLRAAIERALRENLQIRIQQQDLRTADLRIFGARGAYDPKVGFTLGNTSATTPVTSILEGGAAGADVSTTRTFGPTVSQKLPSGGTVNASFTNARGSTNNPFSFVDPVFSSSLTIGFDQPLLRGLFNNPVKHQLTVLNLDARITDAQFRQAVADIVMRVEQQYWNLVYAEEAHRAQQESRDLAVTQRDQTSQKVQAGLLTPVALTSANAEVAIRDQAVLQAEVAIGSAQNGLKRLLSGDPRAPIWGERLVPVDRPDVRDLRLSLDEEMDLAIKRRPELEQVTLQEAQQEENRRFALWETKPTVNLTGNLSSIGRAGRVYQTIFDPATGITPIGRVLDPASAEFGGYQQAWSQVFGYAFPNWNLSLNVDVPVLNRAARAQVAEADVSLRQLDLRMRDTQQAIMVEVSDAYESVRLQRRVLDVARVARELSQEQVRGETARFDAGFTTNFEVLRYQRDLGDARVRELRALLDYQIAVASLQKAVGANLDDADIEIARGGSSSGAPPRRPEER